MGLFDSIINMFGTRDKSGAEKLPPGPCLPKPAPTETRTPGPIEAPKIPQTVFEVAAELRIDAREIIQKCRIEGFDEIVSEKSRVDKKLFEIIEKWWQSGLLDSHPLHADSLFIDSNIWLGPRYERIFEYLKIITPRSMEMSQVQYDEICNLKRKSDPAVAQRARLAQRRIESLLKIRKLTITAPKASSTGSAYFDPVLLKLFETALRLGKRATIVSDDIDVRNRARNLLMEERYGVYILDGQQLLEILDGSL